MAGTKAAEREGMEDSKDMFELNTDGCVLRFGMFRFLFSEKVEDCLLVSIVLDGVRDGDGESDGEFARDSFLKYFSMPWLSAVLFV